MATRFKREWNYWVRVGTWQGTRRRRFKRILTTLVSGGYTYIK